MRVRHKPPTLVSMWMLDVFCCALGCVTLLFLLNSRMATDAVQASRTALLDLDTADQKLAAAISSLDSTRLKLNAEERERGRLAASVTELEGVRLKMADDARPSRSNSRSPARRRTRPPANWPSPATTRRPRRRNSTPPSSRSTRPRRRSM